MITLSINKRDLLWEKREVKRQREKEREKVPGVIFVKPTPPSLSGESNSSVI